MDKMTAYPLLIQFRDVIVGNRFIARVVFDGRALLKDEGNERWVYGVQPNGVAGGSDGDAAGALNAFKMHYQSVLFDIAAEASTFEEFEREVRQFLSQGGDVDA